MIHYDSCFIHVKVATDNRIEMRIVFINENMRKHHIQMLFVFFIYFSGI